MASIKATVLYLGVNTGGAVSVLGHIFGFLRQRVPTDPDKAAIASVSVLTQMRSVLFQPHINLNLIHVGFDAIPGGADALDEALKKLDYAVYRLRNIYGQVGLGVGRVEHWEISAAEAHGRDDLANMDEAEDLIAEWYVPNSSIDAFVVRNISSSYFGGATPNPGECDKGGKNDGSVAGEIGSDFDSFSRTFAHEIGHFLDLDHNHGDDDCPDTLGECNNLMAKSGCARKCGSGVRAAVVLSGVQGSVMRAHCSVQGG